jgi:hypothetical protein
MIIIMS